MAAPSALVDFVPLGPRNRESTWYRSDSKHQAMDYLSGEPDSWAAGRRGGRPALSYRGRIVESRWLKEENPATLHDLAAEFKVSAERIHQIEANAMEKM